MRFRRSRFHQRPLHVVQIVDRLDVGGAETLVLRAASGLDRARVRTSVVSLQNPVGAPLTPAFGEAGVEVHGIGTRTGVPPLADPRRVHELRDLLRSIDADLVHTHLLSSNITGTLAAAAAGLPRLASLHNTKYPDRRRYRVLGALEQYVLGRLAGEIVAVGSTVALAQARRFPRHHLLVVPNPAPPEVAVAAQDVARLRAELLGDQPGPLLVNVGRLSPQKGHSDLLQAFRTVRQVQPGAVLAIAGGGQLEGALAAETARLGLGEAVRLLGPRADVGSILAAADLFVSASRFEGLPLTLLEAMAAGTPAVATAVGDVPRVLGDEVGVLVRPSDPAQLAVAIIDILEDSAALATMSERGRERARTTYGISRWLDTLADLYERTARGAPRVAVVTHGYYPRIGGIERQRASVTPRLLERGLDPVVVCRRDDGLAAFELHRGVPLHRIAVPGPKAFASACFTLSATVRVVALRPDIIQAHQFLSTSRVGLLSARLTGAPLVVVAHRSGPIGDVQLYRGRRSGRRRVRALASRADALVGVSEEICGELTELAGDPDRVRLIQNGIDTARFRPAPPTERAERRSQLGLDREALVVVYVGRLAAEKCVDDLLAVWPALSSDAVLLVVGEGPEEVALRAEAPAGVRFMGMQDDVAEILSIADVFVLPSSAEGLSNASLEAAASGIACILSDVGAARQVIDDGITGVLFEPGDRVALEAALTEMAADPERRARLGAAGRAHVASRFGIESTVDEFVALYDELLERQRR